MNENGRTNAGKRRNKQRFQARKGFAVLLAALIPGLGHLFLGLFIKGLTFMLLLLLDLSAMLYVSSIGMQINIPLLILLGLFVPGLYFYNIYDVLQSADLILYRRRLKAEGTDPDIPSTQMRLFQRERGVSFGILLVLGGSLMILFYQKPRWLAAFFASYGTYTLAVLLVIAGCLFFLREISFSRRRRRG
ncbi:hypothetical protein Q5741_15475 [Paenibacillus sp. JX-17]|uniref:Uncharacterized protein n=1 Tax=Paenibacillus lacisoli TaxID=3064525 RepID=A0ABT9CJG4_9BACL|nr:hypothetical protein [Paenibacillus sp. JX-17]MDO7907811.1 hypothetical protein [Paenibacillus sp. JX-17]